MDLLNIIKISRLIVMNHNDSIRKVASRYNLSFCETDTLNILSNNKDIFNDETGKTSNIIDKDNSLKNDIFFLDVGDKFYVTVKNTNTTISQMIKSVLYSVTGNQSYVIMAQDSGGVVATGYY